MRKRLSSGGARKAALLSGALLLVVGAALAAALLRPRAALAPPSAALQKTAMGLDEIAIEATFTPETRSLDVWQTMTLVSRADEARSELVLRAYPNAFQSADTSPCAAEEVYDRSYPDGFSSGSLVMREAKARVADGTDAPVRYRYTDAAKTVLSLPLPSAWQTGERLTVTLRYTVTLPRAAYRFGVWNGMYAMGNAFLTPAPWENGAYRADAYAPVGDPLPAEAANHTVKLSVPKGFACAASACAAAEEQAERTVYTFTAPAARDFALAVSADYQLTQAMEGDILVSVFATKAARAAEALRYAKAALHVYEERYGAYPYQSLALAECALWDGAAYPALVMLPSALLCAGGEALETAVAREVANQWWYAVVGTDSVMQAWQHEALSEYAVLAYLEAAHGLSSREAYYASAVAPSMRVTMPRGVTPGAPLDYFSTRAQYETLARLRGAAMLCALDEWSGGGLDKALRAYYERYAFAAATRADFTALLNALSGEDCEPLMIDYLDTYVSP